uniref:Low-density lipoprotein receptor-related protein 2 n=1 Tax=Magallana gigas TaxID=29159 RepID=K1PWH4_MAGGI
MSEPDSKICSENEFQCLDICIDKKLNCDQEVNCQDNLDESVQYAGCEDTEISPNKDLCGQLLPRPITSSGNIATIKFKSMVVSSSNGFKLTATVQRKPDSKICSENEFQCLDDICIDNKLKYDQEVNCQDNSDESAQHAGFEGQHRYFNRRAHEIQHV